MGCFGLFLFLINLSKKKLLCAKKPLEEKNTFFVCLFEKGIHYLAHTDLELRILLPLLELRVHPLHPAKKKRFLFVLFKTSLELGQASWHS